MKTPITVKGRGVHDATTEVKIDETGVTLRIDDDMNPEFWCEVRIPMKSLTMMFLAVIEHQAGVREGK